MREVKIGFISFSIFQFIFENFGRFIILWISRRGRGSWHRSNVTVLLALGAPIAISPSNISIWVLMWLLWCTVLLLESWIPLPLSSFLRMWLSEERLCTFTYLAINPHWCVQQLSLHSFCCWHLWYVRNVVPMVCVIFQWSCWRLC